MTCGGAMRPAWLDGTDENAHGGNAFFGSVPVEPRRAGKLGWVPSELAAYADISYHKAAWLWLWRRAEWPGSEGNVTLLPHLEPAQPNAGKPFPRGAGRKDRKRAFRVCIGWVFRLPGRPQGPCAWGGPPRRAPRELCSG